MHPYGIKILTSFRKIQNEKQGIKIYFKPVTMYSYGASKPSTSSELCILSVCVRVRACVRVSLSVSLVHKKVSCS